MKIWDRLLALGVSLLALAGLRAETQLDELTEDPFENCDDDCRYRTVTIGELDRGDPDYRGLLHGARPMKAHANRWKSS